MRIYNALYSGHTNNTRRNGVDLLQNKRFQVIALAIIAIAGIIVTFIMMNKQPASSTDSGLLLGNYAVDITQTRLASAKNALDGSGDLTDSVCSRLGELAKEFKPSSDFVSCSSPKSLYLATPDTSNSDVLTVSDDTYTATFKTDKEFKYLIDYSFSNKPSAGFNSYGGRK